MFGMDDSDSPDISKIWPYLIFAQGIQSLGQSASGISAGLHGKQAPMPANPIGSLLPVMAMRDKQRRRDKALENLKNTPGMTPEDLSLISSGLDLGAEGPLNQFAKSRFGDETGRYLNTSRGIFDTKTKEIMPGTESSKSPYHEAGGSLFNEATGQWIINPTKADDGDNRQFKKWRDTSGADVFGWVDKKRGTVEPVYRSPPVQTGYFQQGNNVYETKNPMDPLISAAEREIGLPSGSGRALVMSESSGDPNALGAAGDSGLTQMVPSTARRVSKELGLNLFSGMNDQQVSDVMRQNPYLNLRLGFKEYSRLREKYKGDNELALIDWNAGADDVQRYLKADRDKSVLKPSTRNLIDNFNANSGHMLPGKPVGSDQQIVKDDATGKLVMVDKRTQAVTPLNVTAKSSQSGDDVQTSLNMINQARQMVRSDPSIVGIYGKGRSWLESLTGQWDADAPQPARDFQHAIEALRNMNLQKILNESGRSISDADRKRMERVLSGTSIWDTPGDVVRDLDFLENLINKQTSDISPSTRRDESSKPKPSGDLPKVQDAADIEYSKEDLEYTAKKYGITVEEVKKRLQQKRSK